MIHGEQFYSQGNEGRGQNYNGSVAFLPTYTVTGYLIENFLFSQTIIPRFDKQ